jgi:hypothetical protein
VFVGFWNVFWRGAAKMMMDGWMGGWVDGVGGYERSLFMPFRTTPVIHSLVVMNIRLSKEPE